MEKSEQKQETPEIDKANSKIQEQSERAKEENFVKFNQ